jgi:hypothetical protein
MRTRPTIPGTSGVPDRRLPTTPEGRPRLSGLGCGILLALLWFSTLDVQAHTASTAWLTLSVSNKTVIGQWEIPLRDLDDALGLDANDDGQLTWGELRARHADVAGYALNQLTLQTDGERLSPRVMEHRISQRSDGPCAVLRFVAEAKAAPRELHVDYHLFFDRDPLHRGLVSQVNPSNTPESRPFMASVLSPDNPSIRFDIGEGKASHTLGTFIREGMHHIWTGYDHLLFLLVLLLPAVLLRSRDGWEPQPSFRRALTQVLQVVTAFTLAHSLTLGLAAFDWVRLPSRLVESTIAVSIVVAAVANLRRSRCVTGESASGRSSHPCWTGRPWLMPFAFGLVHGFGFAGVLAELGLSRSSLGWPLLGFNLGVELGQLACVAGFLPAAYLLRSSRFYRCGAVPIGSVTILLLAAGWFVERAFDLRFLPI